VWAQEPEGSGYMDSRLRGNDGLGSEGARAHVSLGLRQACVTGAVPLPCLPAAGTLHLRPWSVWLRNAYLQPSYAQASSQGWPRNFYRVA